MLATGVTPGQTIAGKYRLEQVLGQGGMGMVVAAFHEQLDQRVAIKFLLPELAANPEAVARFTREARAAARIQSEHVVRIMDVGQLPSGEPYMVMEYLDGCDLATLLAREGTLAPERAVSFILEACEALSEAHAGGTVHRDLKPGNLFLCTRADGTSCIKVLDFGISKATTASEGDAALTKTSGFLGSPLYVSPEQITSSRDVDARSDIWSLGVILYEVLAGAPPFGGESIMEVAAKILQSQPARLRDRRPELSPALGDAVMRCLEKNRDARFANVGDLAQALAPFAPAAGASVERISRVLGGARGSMVPRSSSSPPPAVAVAHPVTGSTSGGHATEGPIVIPRRSYGWIGVGIAAFAALAGAGLMLRAGGGTSTEPGLASAAGPNPVVHAPAAQSVSIETLPEPAPTALAPLPALSSARASAVVHTAHAAATPEATRAAGPEITAPPDSAGPSPSASASAPTSPVANPTHRNPLAVDLK